MDITLVKGPASLGRQPPGSGVVGRSPQGRGIWGISDSFIATVGDSVTGTGIYGHSTQGTGVYGEGNPAGKFVGDVFVTGTIHKGAMAFRIDHPLDPAKMYLSHSGVESNEMKNVYDGTVTLDYHGEAVVELPAWFEALNCEYRYQLTCVGQYAPVFIADKMRGNQFRIAGGTAGQEVCWQVTGVRQDDYARAHPVIVEQLKVVPAGDADANIRPADGKAPTIDRGGVHC